MSPGDPGSPDRSCQEPVSTVRRHEHFPDGPCLENSLRPLYQDLSGIQHLGDLEEGLNRRGARGLDDRRDSDATATRRLVTALTCRILFHTVSHCFLLLAGPSLAPWWLALLYLFIFIFYIHCIILRTILRMQPLWRYSSIYINPS